MPPTFLELPPMPTWQAALTVLPAVVAALAAVLAPRRSDAQAWRCARWVSLLLPALALGALLAFALRGGGQAHGLRTDGTGAAVSVLVTFIGWVIVRYAQTYLAGERGQANAIRWLLATLASVLVVVTSNHLLVVALAWMATSLAMHRLLTFFADRPAAVLTAYKKFVLGRAADVAMLAACALLALQFDTLRIDLLLARAVALPALPLAVHAAAVLVVLAALLKSAQLPFHGWLIQVMEAPTPVSALLHAGVVNLAGVVLIRLAPLVAGVPAACGLLVVAGSATAVIAALVMTTRISIKVSLAWSTCAQMGFMLMQCGLGLWEMALLHLVAHSLYKAHAFLAAGGTVRQAQIRQLADAPAPVGLRGQLTAGGLALAITACAALLFGVQPTAQPALWVAAGIVGFALAPMVRAAWASDARAAGLQAAAVAFALAALYFALHALLQGRVAPAAALPAWPWWLVAAGAFALLFVWQCIVTARPRGALATAAYPWVYGGLFLDERFSRAMFRLWPPPRPAVRPGVLPAVASVPASFAAEPPRA